LDGRVTYAFAVTNGAVDGTNVDNTDTNDRKEFTGRLFLKPLKTSAQPLLAGLGIGIAGSTGRQTGTSAVPGLTTGYKTNAQTNFFTYTSGRAVAAGNRTRWSPQLTWYPGRFGVLGEYVASRQAVQSTSTLKTTDLTHRSWQVAASYVLTGEDVTEKGVTPLSLRPPEVRLRCPCPGARRESRLT
jgi:phosphate-selective porin OprO/OprP